MASGPHVGRFYPHVIHSQVARAARARSSSGRIHRLDRAGQLTPPILPVMTGGGGQLRAALRRNPTLAAIHCPVTAGKGLINQAEEEDLKHLGQKPFTRHGKHRIRRYLHRDAGKMRGALSIRLWLPRPRGRGMAT